MPGELSSYCRNQAVTVWSPEDFQENEAAEKSLDDPLCNVTTALINALEQRMTG